MQHAAQVTSTDMGLASPSRRTSHAPNLCLKKLDGLSKVDDLASSEVDDLYFEGLQYGWRDVLLAAKYLDQESTRNACVAAPSRLTARSTHFIAK